MQVKIEHVQKRWNTYYFRIRIPQELRTSYDGKREITKSLKTQDPTEAIVLASSLAQQYKNQFELLRSGQTISADASITTIPQSIHVQAVPTASKAPLLSEVLEEMNVARSTQAKTMQIRSSAIRLLTDWHGDLPVSDYTRKMMISFRDNGMLHLPPNLYKGDRYKGKPVRLLAKKKHPQTMSRRTVNNKLTYISSVFNYAVKHGYLQRNPNIDLQLPMDKAPSKERDNYTTKQLQRMIDNIARLTKSGADVRHQHFWVTLVCLYQGARLNEIAQLTVSDIVKIDGIHCINITMEGETLKSLKNARSSRLIPIHTTLIQLGLLRFHRNRLKSCKKPETTQLWPQTWCDKDGNYGKKVSRWFNDTLRPKILTKKELADHRAKRKSYCFHSLRHTFITFAQNQARMNPRIEMRLTGHSDTFISEEHARYGKDMHPKIMLEELEKLDFGLDLSALQGRY